MRLLIPSALWRRLFSQRRNQRKKAPSARAARTKRTMRKAPLRTRHPVLWKARLGFLLMAVVAVPGWLLFSQQAAELGRDLRGRAINLSANAGFIIHDVLMEGRSETTRAAVLAALRVTYGQPPSHSTRKLPANGWNPSVGLRTPLSSAALAEPSMSASPNAAPWPCGKGRAVS